MNATRLIALASGLWGCAVSAAVFRSNLSVELLFVAGAATLSIWVIGLHIAESLKRALIAELRGDDVHPLH